MSLSDVKEVKVVSCVRAAEFEEQVNAALRKGYILNSEPTVNTLFQGANYNTRYFVTLYKTKQESI